LAAATLKVYASRWARAGLPAPLHKLLASSLRLSAILLVKGRGTFEPALPIR